MGALANLKSKGAAIRFPRFRPSERSRAVRETMRRDMLSDSEAYQMGQVRATAILVPIVVPATLAGMLLSEAHGLPLLLTGAGVAVMAHLDKLTFLRRLKRGLVAQGSERRPTDIGELHAESLGERVD